MPRWWCWLRHHGLNRNSWGENVFAITPAHSTTRQRSQVKGVPLTDWRNWYMNMEEMFPQGEVRGENSPKLGESAACPRLRTAFTWLPVKQPCSFRWFAVYPAEPLKSLSSFSPFTGDRMVCASVKFDIFLHLRAGGRSCSSAVSTEGKAAAWVR